MIPLYMLAVDADANADGGDGVQVHVDISPLATQTPAPSATPAPIDGLAVTGGDIPMLLIVAAVALVAIGAVLLIKRARRLR